MPLRPPPPSASPIATYSPSDNDAFIGSAQPTPTSSSAAEEPPQARKQEMRQAPHPSGLQLNLYRSMREQADASATPGSPVQGGTGIKKPTGRPARRRADVHVHTMWYSPDPLEHGRPTSQKLARSLQEAFIHVSSGATTMPENAKAHLWTDRKSLHALYRSDEIPHSMIDSGLVEIHTAEAVERMIAEVADPQVRGLFQRLHGSSMIENIGARTDIERLLYVLLYRSPADNATTTKDALNLHIDIDTLVDALAGQDAYKLRGLERAKATFEHFKSVRTSTVHSRAGSNLLDLPGSIVSRLRSKGLASNGTEIELLASVPMSARGIEAAKNILSIIENDQYVHEPELPEEVAWMTETHLATVVDNAPYLRELNTRNPSAERILADQLAPTEHGLSPAGLQDYFRIAEKIRRSRPRIQQHINNMARLAATMPGEGGVKIFEEMSALASVYSFCIELIEGQVNRTTYLPQVSGADLEMAYGIPELMLELFGQLPSDGETAGSWKSANLELGAASEAAVAEPTYKGHAQAWEQLKRFVAAAEW